MDASDTVLLWPTFLDILELLNEYILLIKALTALAGRLSPSVGWG